MADTPADQPAALDEVRADLRQALEAAVVALPYSGGTEPHAAGAVRDLADAYVRLGGDLELAPPEAPPPADPPDVEAIAAAAWHGANAAGASTFTADAAAAAVRAMAELPGEPAGQVARDTVDRLRAITDPDPLGPTG